MIDADRVEADVLADEVFELGGVDFTESFEPDDWVALADMWQGPLKHNPHIVFTVKGDSMPPSWVAELREESRHV